MVSTSTDLPLGVMPSGSEDGNRDCQYMATIPARKRHLVSHDDSLGTLFSRPAQPHFFSLLHHSTCHRDSKSPGPHSLCTPHCNRASGCRGILSSPLCVSCTDTAGCLTNFSLSSGLSRRYSQARPFSILSISSTVFVFLSHVDPGGLSVWTMRRR
jgi:hypothetical protein